jgi:hypothetical protein
MKIVDNKVYDEKDIERLNNKKLIVFFDAKEGKFNFFLGRIKNNNDFVRNKLDVKTSFVFHPASSIQIEQDITLFGERIEFKNSDDIDADVIKGIFSSIAAGLEAGNWNSLEESVKDLAELLMFKDEKEIMNKVLGYVGEMLFIKYMSEINISQYREIAKELFNKYHRKDESKHDFTLNPNLKIEVKTTTSENLNFKIKDSQTYGITNSTELYYVFIKTENIGKDLGGKNLLTIVEDLKSKLEVNDDHIPNHLKIGCCANGWNNYYFDVEDFDIYIIDSKKMPDFSQYRLTCYISDVTYTLDMIEFTKKIEYNKSQILIDFVEKMQKGI